MRCDARGSKQGFLTPEGRAASQTPPEAASPRPEASVAAAGTAGQTDRERRASAAAPPSDQEEQLFVFGVV